MNSGDKVSRQRTLGGWARVASATDGARAYAPGATPELHRFKELWLAFADLARERHDLHVRGAAALPPQGFAVRLQPRPTSGGGELCLWLDGGRLTTWSAEEDGCAAAGDDRSVHLELSVAFGWEGLLFADAERLAYTLLRWMEDQIAGDGAGASPAEAS